MTVTAISRENITTTPKKHAFTISNKKHAFTISNKKHAFTIGPAPTKKKFAFKINKPKPDKSQYALFVELCNKHSLPYFQFYDEDSWCGPVTKVLQDDFNTVIDIFEAAQHYLKTLVLHGYGFVIIKPVQKMDDNEIHYPQQHFSQCRMTEEPIIPYNSDMDDSGSEFDSEPESDSEEQSGSGSEEIIVEEEFIAEEWKYNNTIYLLDTSTNYVYSPSTLEFVGKKTSEFSIDYDAKEC